MAFRVFLLCVLTAIGVGGCTMVARDGPTGVDVQATAAGSLQRSADAVGYALVALSPSVLAAANAPSSAPAIGFDRLPRTRASRDVRIAPGDQLHLTIFESQAGGLFIPQDAGSRAGNFVAVPNQQVDATGQIVVPYAGVVRAAGLTTTALSAAIARRLADRAIEPQVVVSIAERHGNDISVLGAVNAPLRFADEPGGIRLLAAIARAAGPKDPPHETTVSVQRNGTIAQMSMSALLRAPAQNIELAPGDVVYLARRQKVFLVFGATPSPGSVGGINDRRFSFDDDTMSLAEAVAKAGGLDGARADSTSVFVFRSEPREKLAALGLDTAAYAGAVVPTVYVGDWSRSDAFFLANNFAIRDKDVIFVSDHPTADFLKLAAVVRAVTGGAYEAGTTAVVAIK